MKPEDVTGDEVGAPPLERYSGSSKVRATFHPHDQEDTMTTPAPEHPYRWPEMDEPPAAHYEQRGRVTWAVWVSAGICVWGPDGRPWTVYGLTPAHAERRAARKARTVLAKYQLESQRRAVHRTIHSEG